VEGSSKGAWTWKIVKKLEFWFYLANDSP
jgi:hypothetical protein